MENKAKIILKNVTVRFAQLEPVTKDGSTFKPNITIDATDPAIQKQIKDWAEHNKLGKASEAGVVKFKTYKPEDGDEVVQYSFKLSDKTEFLYEGDLNKSSLGYGAVISLVASTYAYTKFGGGVSSSISLLKVHKGATVDTAEDLAALEEELGVEDGIEASEIPF